jgi:hypothetical protein
MSIFHPTFFFGFRVHFLLQFLYLKRKGNNTCEKYAHLSKLKEWTQTHEVQQKEDFDADLARSGIKHFIGSPASSLVEYCGVYILFLDVTYFLLGYLKICLSWDWPDFRSGICFFLWQEGLPVICAFWHVHSFYLSSLSLCLFFLFVIYPSQFRLSNQLPLPRPQHCKLI